jgi:hypothetical protein
MTPGASAGGALARSAFISEVEPAQGGVDLALKLEGALEVKSHAQKAGEDEERHHGPQAPHRGTAARDGEPQQRDERGADEGEGNGLLQILVVIEEHQLDSGTGEAEEKDGGEEASQARGGYRDRPGDPRAVAHGRALRYSRRRCAFLSTSGS